MSSLFSVIGGYITNSHGDSLGDTLIELYSIMNNCAIFILLKHLKYNLVIECTEMYPLLINNSLSQADLISNGTHLCCCK